jgi:hypothetical protein
MTKTLLGLTDKDHLRWSLSYTRTDSDPVEFGKRAHANDRLNFTVGSCSGQALSWAQELDQALTKLTDTHGRKLALFYSGGSDSEVILRTLVKLGVTPEVHIIKFSEGLNAHETANADELCRCLGLEPYVWTHDVGSYVKEKRFLHLGLRYTCTQIAYLTVLEYVRRVSLPVIMGGEIYLQRHQVNDGAVHSPQEWYYIYREDEDGVTYRYSVDTGHPVINEVMTYTPELLYSWLVHPTIASVANNEHLGKITILSVKRSVYEQELGYKLQAQSKFHGYERLQWTNLNCRNILQRYMPKMQVAKLEYFELIRHLRGHDYARG